MKIIDLLNKIANGEEIPNKIKYKEEIYYYVLSLGCYVEGEKEPDKLGYQTENYGWLDIYQNNLNDEVEIIEENNKIEKIPYHFSLNYVKSNLTNEEKEGIDEAINGIYDKINELIHEVNKLKEDK